MAETSNIAKAADDVSKKIFSVFGWSRNGLSDTNWTCCKPDEHSKSTHPTDVVFWYDDPYTNSRIYLNTDLKSYSKTSVSNKSNLTQAISSLGLAVDCASVSSEWQQRYVHEGRNSDIRGLLFIYNHDGDYDSDFFKLLNKVSHKDIEQPVGTEIHIMSPQRIAYLNTVANDIRSERGTEGGFPAAQDCTFYYPHQVHRKARSPLSPSASIEVLTGPWQILHFVRSVGGVQHPTYIIYSSGTGATSDEFKYMIDFLFRMQLASPKNVVNIRMPLADSNASSMFNIARESYFDNFYQHFANIPDVRRTFDNITFSSITNVVPSYSSIELGMNHD